jgi:hypothetical protein
MGLRSAAIQSGKILADLAPDTPQLAGEDPSASHRRASPPSPSGLIGKLLGDGLAAVGAATALDPVVGDIKCGPPCPPGARVTSSYLSPGGAATAHFPLFRGSHHFAAIVARCSSLAKRQGTSFPGEWTLPVRSGSWGGELSMKLGRSPSIFSSLLGTLIPVLPMGLVVRSAPRTLTFPVGG